MESAEKEKTALSILEWQLELGADEAQLNEPINRYQISGSSSEGTSSDDLKITGGVEKDAVGIAEKAASSVDSLKQLKLAVETYDFCELKAGARNIVFSDGNPKAKVMIVGEAPGFEEDRKGRPFVGRAGQLLDKMLISIGLSRFSSDHSRAVYIINVLPWRPPNNRDPTPNEISMMLPFLNKHISLINPSFVLAMGNIACYALVGERGITKLRGTIQNKNGFNILPMFHPAYLLRNPSAKKFAWEDLLMLRSKLDKK